MINILLGYYPHLILYNYRLGFHFSCFLSVVSVSQYLIKLISYQFKNMKVFFSLETYIQDTICIHESGLRFPNF